MDTNKIQQAYADKRAAEQQSQQSVKDTEKYTKRLIGSERIQKAIIESARLSIEHRDGHEPKVEVKNFPKSVKTPDVKEVVDAINQMSKDVAPKNIDFSPLQKSIANLSKQIARLPTEYPESPEPVEEVMVNNLSELKPQLEDITKAVEKLKLDPKIDVSVPKTKPLDLTPIAKMVGLLEKSISSIKIPDNSKQFNNIAKAQEAVTKAINDLEFPVANYILPFKNIEGAAVQVQLDSSGNIPTSAGSTPLKLELDDTSTANVTYVGKAAIGSATSDSVWQIQKINETTGMEITWANNGLFTAKWTEILTETYT